VLVDPGRYEVHVDESRERIVLSNDERSYALTGFFRAAKAQVKSPRRSCARSTAKRAGCWSCASRPASMIA